MSELSPSLPEKKGSDNPELANKSDEALRQLHEKAKENRHEHADNLEDIRKTTEVEAKSAEETAKDIGKEKPSAERPLYVNRELKSVAYQRTLKRTRDNLPAYARPLSKLIHNPAVESISEFGAKTVARPSGIFAGGVTAFLGSSLFLWVARHYGYEYNFLLFAFLFVGGFFLGLVIELAIRLLRRQP